MKAGDGKTVRIALANGTEIDARVNMLTLKLLTEDSRDASGQAIKGTRITDYSRKARGGLDDSTSLELLGKVAFAVLKSNGVSVVDEDEALSLIDIDDESLAKLMDMLSARMTAEKKSEESRRRRPKRKRKRK